MRHTPSEEVKIKATPLHNRYRDTMAGQSQPAPVAWPLPRLVSNDPPPSSGGSVIPATAPRKGFRDALQNSVSPAFDVIGSTPARKPMVDMIDATPAAQTSAIASTPVRQTARPAMQPAGEQSILQSSPLMPRRAAPSQYLAVPKSGASRPADLSGVRSLKDIFRTPVKPKVAIAPAVEVKEVEKEPAVADKKVSVYERLGWDNEFDDL